MTEHDQDEERTRSLAWATEAGDAPRLLVFWDGGFAARRLETGATIVVGRSQDADVHVLQTAVSRRHVAVHVGPPLEVEDLGSANGTRVDGRVLRANERVALAPGSVVEAGSAILFVHVPATGDVSTSFAASPRAASESPMERVRRLVEHVAASGLSVLVVGETGVGKEVTARAIHERSYRASGPFVALNCAAFPEQLLESELFGHEKGAFTGAVKSKPGLLETANRGTVFLDEVAEMPLATQAKLLRVLEAREVLRVGALEPRPIDVRFVAATNQNLVEAASRGSFRRDLYYRLNGITLKIPPLRDRKDEIGALARAFVAEACARQGRASLSLDPRGLALLEGRSWQGNIRELRNVVERAVVLCRGPVLGPEHWVFDDEGDEAPIQAYAAAPSADFREDVAGYERARIADALERAGGSQTRAAELLGLSRRALAGRIATLGLPRPRKDKPKP